MKQRKFLVILTMILVLVLSVGALVACNPDDSGNDVVDDPVIPAPSDDPSEPEQQINYDYVDPATCEHIDSDHNCVCDNCFTSMGHQIGADGVCTVCNNVKRVSGNYTYQDAVTTIATNWNQHTYQTSDDSYPIDFITNGLYEFHFNGSKNGYEIWPVMASAYPEDITTSVKSDSVWEIPTDATKGYAYRIRLNKNAKWSDGTPINADTYIESYKLLMDPDYQNYRAADYTSGNVVFKNSKKYLLSKQADVYSLLTDKYETLDLALAADADIYVDAYEFWNAKGYTDEDGNECPQYLSIKDETVYDSVGKDDPVSGKMLYDEYANYLILYEVAYVKSPNSSYGFEWEDGVGIYKTDEYEFVIVLEKSCSGFYLLYGLSGNWIVNVDQYRALTTVDGITGERKNTYNTSLETTFGYGPYKMSQYQEGKYIEFVRDDNWWGYSDSRFDCMYQTSKVTCEAVSEPSTRLQMFLKGQLETYGLQTEDYTQYGTSKSLYVSPGTTIYFMILYGNEKTLEGVQTEGINKTILANDDFRKALSVTFDKAEFCRDIQPSCSAAFSVIGAYDIWNPSTGEKYRDTDIAKQAIADYYGILKGTDDDGDYYYFTGKEDVKYDTIDEAIDALTGVNPVMAKELFLKAYNEWLSAGKIKATDTIEIEYAASKVSSFTTKMINYLNDVINGVLKGTVLENRVKIVVSSPLDTEWADNLKSGASQTCLAGWLGGMLDPFGSMLYYFDNNHDPYAKQWWDTSKVDHTITLPVGEGGADVTITMTLQDWAQCLTGEAKNVSGKTYNFGFEQVKNEVRLTIMAELEKVLLATNYYIPMMQGGSAFMLSQKLTYALPASDYNAVLGRGGLTYIRYNYTDEAWKAFVDAQGGTLSY